MNVRANNSGMTIIEVLISITLGALLLAGVASVFVSNKTTNRVQQGLARLQENGRYATFTLQREIRQAGYQGCNNFNVVEINNVVRNPSPEIDLERSISGYEAASGGWSPALPTSIASDVRVGTDVLKLQSTSNSVAQIALDMDNPIAALIINARETIVANDLLLISDCEDADLFVAGSTVQVSTIVHPETVNVTAALSKQYQTDAQVFKYEYTLYYIKDSGRTNEAGQAIFSLFTRDLSGNETELVEGVENLQIIYGVDTNQDGVPDSFDSAATVESGNNWTQVVTVRVDLLVNTIEDINPQPRAYTFMGNTTTPADRKLRRQWTSYVKIRNRI